MGGGFLSAWVDLAVELCTRLADPGHGFDLDPGDGAGIKGLDGRRPVSHEILISQAVNTAAWRDPEADPLRFGLLEINLRDRSRASIEEVEQRCVGVAGTACDHDVAAGRVDRH
jgi:hypothetical protein